MLVGIKAATLFMLLVIAQATGASEGPSYDNWRYTASREVRPIARSIGLSEDVPQDLEQAVSYRGKLRRYAQLRYGSENSRRVVVVVDDLGDGNYDLYVDLDRDRIITDGDRLDGEGKLRSFELDTEIVKADQPKQTTRRVELRLSATAKRLSVATVGFIEGVIPWTTEGGGKELLHVRRVDGNANGLFADSRDRVLLDLDRDGDWNRVTEQFAYLPILKLKESRYAVRSDRLGEKFSLLEINGVGNVRIVVNALPDTAKVLAFEAMIFSDDGSAYSLKELNQPLPVPVGRYTLGSVTMTIDNGEKDPWHFVFSRGGSIKENQWSEVAADKDVSLEAVGQTRFELATGAAGHFRPGDSIVVNPTLHTEDGLLINLSSRGRQMGSFDRERFHNCCQISLLTAAGEKVSAAKSGFA